MKSPPDLDRAYEVAESIASRDLNNLYLASLFFAEPVRYRVFCVFYAVMRWVDDRVDDLAARGGGSPEEHARVVREVAWWRDAIDEIYTGAMTALDDAPDSVGEAALLLPGFTESVGSFRVPWQLWKNFFDAMERDLASSRFATYGQFLEYAEGATVAPTTIYLFLLSSSSDRAGSLEFRPPEGFQLIECGRQLGLFAYLTHILRDLPKDLAAGEAGLVYLAEDDMARFGVSLEDLRTCLGAGSASGPVRLLLAELGERAWGHLETGRALLADLGGRLGKDCAFVLSLIVRIYEAALERIADQGYDPFPERHRLGMEGKRRIVLRTAEELDFPLEAHSLADRLFAPTVPAST